jgi:hypothetical protein
VVSIFLIFFQKTISNFFEYKLLNRKIPSFLSPSGENSPKTNNWLLVFYININYMCYEFFDILKGFYDILGEIYLFCYEK